MLWPQKGTLVTKQTRWLWTQTKLTTEPKETPEEVLKFAEAFEEGISQQKTYGNPTMIKDEPVCNVAQGTSGLTKPSGNEARCFRCGFENFTPAHLKDCRAKNENAINVR